MTTQVQTQVSANPPPTVPGWPLVGNTFQLLRGNGQAVHWIGREVQQRGDVLRLAVGGRRIYIVAHPDLLQDILVRRVNLFHKVSVSQRRPTGLGRFLGNGILSADHEAWRPQRRLIQPLMHTQYLSNYADTMVAMGEKLLARWQNGETRNIHQDMNNVTMWIIAETMFGSDMTDAHSLEELMRRGQQLAISDLTQPLPAWMLARRDRVAAHINAQLTALVERFMAERRASGDLDRGDLLALLMQTTDEDGQPMPAAFVRDNILTLFAAGHETTANTLTWALHFLDQHPHVAARLHEEVDTVLAGRAPTLADLPHLPYTLQVIKETMRYEPTVALLPRYLLDDVTLGGYQLQANSMMVLALHTVHHDPRWWEQPDAFDPARFTPEMEAKLHKYAYLPFGGGPRVCIGNHFALMEAQLLLALIASRYTLHSAGDAPVPQRYITTAPKGGLPMRVQQRV